MKIIKLLIPLLLFVGMVGLFYATLDRDTRLVPSPLIGKPAPEFSLPTLTMNAGVTETLISPQQLIGKPWLLNVWASWCRECRIEHPLFNQLAQQYDFQLVGMNYKDQANDAQQWLRQFGDPFSTIIYDNKGSAGLDLGVYGVPETFLIDAQGIIRYKHVGPINAKTVNDIIVPFFQSQ